jgi:hypothetical protein
VSEALLDHLDVSANLDHEADGRMPQAVEREPIKPSGPGG